VNCHSGEGGNPGRDGKMTYQDLYDQLKNLSSLQRQQEVRTLGSERRGAKIDKLWIAEEDYINPSGDGIEPISAYKDDDENDISGEPIAVHAGTVLLEESNN